jgi:hypothetical protein
MMTTHRRKRYEDVRFIAQLVKDRRYTEPTITQGVYEEIPVAEKIGDPPN